MSLLRPRRKKITCPCCQGTGQIQERYSFLCRDRNVTKCLVCNGAGFIMVPGKQGVKKR